MMGSTALSRRKPVQPTDLQEVPPCEDSIIFPNHHPVTNVLTHSTVCYILDLTYHLYKVVKFKHLTKV